MLEKSLFTIFTEVGEALFLIEKECVDNEHEKMFFNHIYKFLDEIEARYRTQIYKACYASSMSRKDKEAAEKFHDFLTRMVKEHAKFANEIAKIIK